MALQMTFQIPWEKYDVNGFNTLTGILFTDTLAHWEEAFHDRYSYCYANYMYANGIGMNLLDKCLLDPSARCGFELLNGKVDLETCYKIDDYSDVSTIYAIGSQLAENLEEPIFLVLDDSLADGEFRLKYLPEDDDEEVEQLDPIPVEEIFAR